MTKINDINQYLHRQIRIPNACPRVYQQILAGTVMALSICMLVELPAPATQSFSCQGQMDNGWRYTAEFVNGRFTQIRWQRAGQPSQTTNLKFLNTNKQQQPVYTGAFQAATQVTLVDLSGGNVKSGSSISVTVEEWGTSTGQCGTSSHSNRPSPLSPGVRQLACRGQMKNGWAYSAKYTDGGFTQIRWERADQPPQITTLTSQGNNTQGQPVYRGSFQAATMISLVDLSRGNVKPGSQVSVGAEEWGWARGNCRSN